MISRTLTETQCYFGLYGRLLFYVEHYNGKFNYCKVKNAIGG